jgi:hypothetical protein
MNDQQTERLIAASLDLLTALRVIAANGSSIQIDPQWAVQIAKNAIEPLRGIPTPNN